MATRDEIISDAERMGLPSDMATVTIALAEFQNGLPVDQKCLRCGKPFEVVALPHGTLHPQAWAVICDCGESVFRGL